MKRPFLVIGTAALFASYFVLAQNIFFAAVILIFVGFTAVVLTFKGKETIIKTVLIGAIFLLIATRLYFVDIGIKEKTEQFRDRTVNACGIIIEIIYKSENYSIFVLKTTKTDLDSAKGIKASVAVYEYVDFSVGDEFVGRLEYTEQNEKYKARNYSEATYFSFIAKDYYISHVRPFSVYSLGEDVRRLINKAIYSTGVDNSSGVLKALIMGDDSDISDKFYQNVKNSGVSHMLVVSGMHLGIICGAIMRLMSMGFLRKRSAVVLSVLTSLFLLVICFFHVSIFRAAITCIIMLVGMMVNKNSDGLNSLGFATFLLVIIYPYIFYNVAFLLSLSATFAVIYPSSKLMSLIELVLKKPFFRVASSLINTVVISLCATVCTMPITVKYFGSFSLVAPFTNLLVCYAVSAALILGVIATVLYFIPLCKGLSIILYVIAKYCCRFFIGVVDRIGSSELGVVKLSSNGYIYCLITAVLFVAVLAVLCSIIQKRKDDGDAQRKNT